MEPRMILHVPASMTVTAQFGVAARHERKPAVSSLGYSEIECLACGTTRLMRKSRRAAAGECPQCDYLGWEFSARLPSGERQRRRGRIEPRRPLAQFLAAGPARH